MKTPQRLAFALVAALLFTAEASATADRVYENFLSLSQIPRCSKQEDRASAWLVDWARQRKFPVRTDARRNVVISVPATAGYETHPTVALQAHIDMVCQKTPESPHDFTRDPIVPVRDGDWLRAKDTTLGADDGIGVATALTIAEDRSLPHPPLELLFTTDEEIDMTGAADLARDFLTAKRFINLDSEEEGTVTLGAAGGVIMDLTLPLRFAPLGRDDKILALRVQGLTGGHSGLEIHRNRGNANLLAARALTGKLPFRLISFSGGTAGNAITRTAEVIVAVPAAKESALRDQVSGAEREARLRHPDETALTMTVTPIDTRPASAATPDDSAQVVAFIASLPYGVQAWSNQFPGLPETSVNIGIVKTVDDAIKVTSYQRSFSPAELERLSRAIEAKSAEAGATSLRRARFPPWAPDPASSLYQRSIETYRKTFGTEAKTVVLHAGLECGYIAEKYPGMEVISIGPTLRNVHTTEEKLDLPSVKRFWTFTTALLSAL